MTTTTISNPMPCYAIEFQGRFLGYAHGVSYRQALRRAKRMFPGKTIAISSVGGRLMTDKERIASNRKAHVRQTTTRKTGDFEARRATEIAKAKAAGLI